jgi:SAM-dependent methyltransferase
MTLADKIPTLPEAMRPEAAPGTWEAALSLLPASGSVFHAGAGRGGLSWLLKDAGYSVTSVDLYPDRFAMPGMECTYSDLNNPIPFPSGVFDVVLAVEVMEHLESPWRFLREAVRLLNSGGIFIFSTPNVISIPSRFSFLLSGVLPYFRMSSFKGCYHVTPIFPWSVERFCLTTSARIRTIKYSRADWPGRNDIPRHVRGRGIANRLRLMRRLFLDLLPRNALTGEISVFCVEKTVAPAAFRSEPMVNYGDAQVSAEEMSRISGSGRQMLR